MKLSSMAASVAHSITCVAALTSFASAQKAELPVYKPTRMVAGTIHVCGSPQMADLLHLYEQGFVQVQPAVTFDNQLKSTSSAVEGVYTGRAEIGLLGREIWPSELQAFESVAAHLPVVIDIATGSYDVPKATFALMIFVPKANPIASLSISQLERIFSSSDHPIRYWGDLGLGGAWVRRPVHLYGFTADNDKSRIFSQLVFAKEESWNSGLNPFSNGAGPNGKDAGELILKAVAEDSGAIGISNIYYATPDVKALAISTPEQKAPIMPTRQNVANRSYPLTRAVYMVVDHRAAHPSSTAVVEFLRYVLSSQGAQAVMREGTYLPLPPETALRQIRQLSAQSR
ncbi:MAG TPA: substrate-binding domain-containing protein [Terracidiphilus sp.]|nr:substrate-binding domain-containing protein [Terracidiphilus sp.]